MYTTIAIYRPMPMVGTESWKRNIALLGLKNGEKKPSYPKRLLQKQKN